MENKLIRVAITHGDTNGIGYEIILKAFADPALLELCTPIVYGSPKVATYHRKTLNLETGFNVIERAEEACDGKLNILACCDEEVKVELGQPSEEAGRAALMALDRAMTDYRSGLYDVLVTAPINKATIQGDGFHFPGHTEYIETCVGEGQQALMILMNEDLRVALVTTHLPSATWRMPSPKQPSWRKPRSSTAVCSATSASPVRASPCSRSIRTRATTDY